MANAKQMQTIHSGGHPKEEDYIWEITKKLRFH